MNIGNTVYSFSFKGLMQKMDEYIYILYRILNISLERENVTLKKKKKIGQNVF